MTGSEAYPTLAAVWRRHLLAWGVAVAVILAVLHQDTLHLLHLWWNTSTFGHCLLIPPILGWLVWQRRQALAQLVPGLSFAGVALVLAGGVLWLLGDVAGVAVVRHAALVFMLQASVLAVFGMTVVRGLVFPLFYALFMIPLGEQLVPYLQTFTAKFSIALLELFNVPAYLDGVFISIPNGDFEVAEACSGVRFLIAMIAFSVLVANVCFLSWTRRIAFILSAVILSVVANGLRAWGTIYIAYRTTPDFARGVDHVVYGWFFFAVVLVMVMAIWWRFFDRPVEGEFIDVRSLQPGNVSAVPPRKLALLLTILVAATFSAPGYALWVQSRTTGPITNALAFAAPPGWRRTAYAGVPWTPVYEGASATAMATFDDGSGQKVDLYVAVFDHQGEGHELIGYGQGLIRPTNEDGGWAWAGDAAPPPGGLAAQINYGGRVRDVWQWYLVNGRILDSPYAAKIEGLKARLLGGPQQAATIIISAQRVDPMIPSHPALARFAAAAGRPDKIIAHAVIAGGR